MPWFAGFYLDSPLQRALLAVRYVADNKMLALCVALAASPHSAECAFVRPLSRVTARVSARPRLLHPTVPPRRALLIAMQAKAPRAAPSFLELLKFTVFAMPIYRTPIHLLPSIYLCR